MRQELSILMQNKGFIIHLYGFIAIPLDPRLDMKSAAHVGWRVLHGSQVLGRRRLLRVRLAATAGDARRQARLVSTHWALTRHTHPGGAAS